MSPLYVYALVDEEGDMDGARGMAGEPLRVVPVAGLGAVVGEIEQAPSLEKDALKGHDAVVREIARRVPAVLPARFGSLAEDEAGLAARIKERAAGLRDALALVRGREQMTLRLFSEVVLVPPEPPRDAGPGARYLAGRAAASGSAVRAHPAVARMLGAVASWVHAERLEAHSTPPLLASVYHLVDRGMAGDYRRALEAAASKESELKVLASGPWPPYAFTGEDA